MRFKEILKLVYPSPQQDPKELEWFWKQLHKVKPKTILEIGTGCGAFTTMLGFYGAKITTVDHIDNPKRFWNYQKIKDTKAPMDIKFIKGNSQTNKIAKLVKGKYDLVILDADHSAKGGLADFENYGYLATKAIAIHDISGYEFKNNNKPSPCGNKWDWFPTRYWFNTKNNEPDADWSTEEITSQNFGGWGIIYLKGK